MLQVQGGEMINKRRTIEVQKMAQAHYREGSGSKGLLEDEDYEDKEGLSRVQSNSNPTPN